MARSTAHYAFLMCTAYALEFEGTDMADAWRRRANTWLRLWGQEMRP